MRFPRWGSKRCLARRTEGLAAFGLVFFCFLIFSSLRAFSLDDFEIYDFSQLLSRPERIPPKDRKPVYGPCRKRIGYWGSIFWQGEKLELIWTEQKNFLIALGAVGQLLEKSLAESRALAQRVISSRFGGETQIDDISLVYLGPLHYFFRIDYSCGEKRFDDLLIEVTSGKIVNLRFSSDREEAGDFFLQKENTKRDGSTIEEFEVVGGVVSYPYYISDKSTCLAMIMSWWARRGFSALERLFVSDSNTQHYTGEHFAEELIREIDIVGTGCRCSELQTVVEIFGSARGCFLEVTRYSTLGEGGSLLSFSLIKKLIRGEKQPFLIEIISQGITRYAVGIGFLQWGEERYIVSLLPEVGEEKASWRLYFFRWQAGYDEFNLYRICPQRGSR